MTIGLCQRNNRPIPIIGASLLLYNEGTSVCVHSLPKSQYMMVQQPFDHEPNIITPHTRYTCVICYTVLGTRNFAVAGPLVWNSLPANIHSASVSRKTFARSLKTYLSEPP